MKSRRIRVLYSLPIVIGLYVGLFFFIRPIVGDSAFMAGLVLPLLGGWYGSARTGILYALVTLFTNSIISWALGFGFVYSAALPSYFFLPLVGAIVGRYRSLTYALKVEVAQRLRFEAQMLRHQTKLLESGRFVAVAQMAGGIAHDITNPLMIIEGMVDRIRKIPKNAEDAEKRFEDALTRITSNTQRIATVIRGVRAMAWAREDDEVEVVDVEAMLDDVTSIARERFRNHGVELKVVNNCGTAFIKCQRLQISQVLLNLLNNSSDALMSIPESRWVEIEVIKHENQIQIAVTDNGPEVSIEVRDKILQPFFSTKKKQKHLGLGLTLSKQILDRHHGKIFFDAKSPHTRFVIRLPLLDVASVAA